MWGVPPEGVTSVTNSISNVDRDYPAKCYRCEFKPEPKKEYDIHCRQNHPCLSGYPNKASLKKFGLKAQDKPWEV